MTYHQQLAALKREIVTTALQRANGCRSETARTLGITQFTLRSLIRTLKVAAPPVSNSPKDHPRWMRALADGRVGRPRKRRVRTRRLLDREPSRRRG